MDKVLKAVETRKCVGCGNCEQVCSLNAISFSVSNGFKYPTIDIDKCVSCGKCNRVCPVNEDEKMLFSPISYYAAFANDDKMPSDSTSGGICTLLSEMIINDGGVVFSVRFTDDWNAEYARVDTIDSLLKHIGSKYLQADYNSVQTQIATDLKDGKRVLVIGTPCFVSAVTKFLDFLRIDRSNLITIDFLCHGVPSPDIVSAFIRSLDTKSKKLKSYNFRSKASGWGKLTRSTKYEGEDEKAIRAAFCPLHTWFGHHLSLRESCFNCEFRNVDRISDITVADFWKIEKYYPEIPFKQGVSSVQINTPRGERAFCDLKDSGNVVTEKVSFESIWEHRKTATQNFKKPDGYDEFWQIWSKSGLEGLKKAFPAQNYWGLIKAKISSKFRWLGGFLSGEKIKGW